MGKRILILDDDVDFNGLLTDIFQQADYEVVSQHHPEKALKVFEDDGKFDLVVTDQKMPVMTGVEFMQRVREMDTEVPVIVVSGYLDNDTIRDLIRDGVGGVFLKPLNVFSLLKRTSELIEERGSNLGGFDTAEAEATGGNRMRAYPCKSSASVDFARKLKEQRGFKSNLLLICERGIPARQICEDFREMHDDPESEVFEYLTADRFTPGQMDSLLARRSNTGIDHLTLVFTDGVAFGRENADLYAKLVRKDGHFGESGLNFRFIFCLHEDLDSLFEQGVIDDNLYIMLGTTELRAPALRDAYEDVPILAQQYVVDSVTELGLSNVPRIDRSGRDYLKEQPWAGNHEELRAAVQSAVTRVMDDVLTEESFTGAITYASGPGGPERTFSAAELYRQLRDYRDSYLRAILKFANNDPEVAAELLSIDPRLFDKLLPEPEPEPEEESEPEEEPEPEEAKQSE